MYSELYAAWLREIDDTALQPLPVDFYAQVADYIRRITEETRTLDPKALKAALLEQELKNAKRIVKQLTRMRYKKIVKLVNDSQKLPSELLTAEEAQLSKGYSPLVKGYRAFDSFKKRKFSFEFLVECCCPGNSPHRRRTYAIHFNSLLCRIL